MDAWAIDAWAIVVVGLAGLIAVVAAFYVMKPDSK